jgi:hypothetical protein
LTSIGLTLVVVAHLAAVYLAMMGPMVCLGLQWWTNGDNLAARLDRYLLRLAVLALLAAAVLGGLALGLICRLFPEAYGAASRVLPASRYWYGGVELVFSLVCLLVALALAGGVAVSPLRFTVRWLATLLGGANLVYHFPPLFVMLGVLSTRPAAWGHRIKFTTLLTDAEVLARVTHHLLAALVVTGMAIVWYGARRGGDDARAVAWGARIAAPALVFQLVSGLWLAAVMPAESRSMLLGEDSLAAALFGLSLLATFFVLPRLGAMALGHLERRHAVVTIGLVLALLILMTATRHRTRDRVLGQQVQLQKNFASP